MAQPYDWQATQLFLSIALSLGAAGLCLLIYRTWRGYVRLSEFRGPPSAGVSKLWLLKCVTSGKMNCIFYETTRKYGEWTFIC